MQKSANGCCWHEINAVCLLTYLLAYYCVITADCVQHFTSVAGRNSVTAQRQ